MYASDSHIIRNTLNEIIAYIIDFHYKKIMEGELGQEEHINRYFDILIKRQFDKTSFTRSNLLKNL